MEEVNCPFCGESYEFDTADIRDEGTVEEVTCDNCDKLYSIILSISWNYYADGTVS